MRMSKRKLNGEADATGEVKPPALQMAIIRQFATSFYVEKNLHIPDNTFFIN